MSESQTRARSDATADIDPNILAYLSKKRSNSIPIVRNEVDKFSDMDHTYGTRAKRVMSKHNNTYLSKQYYDSKEIHSKDLTSYENDRWWESKE